LGEVESEAYLEKLFGTLGAEPIKACGRNPQETAPA
jgi:hypothetical protein